MDIIENWSSFPKKEKKIRTGRKNNRETIAALATPPGKGGIGIIRISGEKALEIAGKIFVPANNKKVGVEKIKHRRMDYGAIVEPESGDWIDEVILCPMLAPHSYTREDVVEIQSHAGPAVVEKILDIVMRCGARLADPGEFTKRAFLNGRIDLTRAEAVIDLINAKTEAARKIAGKQLDGQLSARLDQIRQKLIQSLAEIEAEIDFSEETEEEPFVNRKAWENDIFMPLKQLCDSAKAGAILKNGINVVLAGKPNVGKSSLMNRLLREERSIVTPYPGTTRDHIEQSFELNGVLVRLFDTAGLRESKDPIEKIGVQRSRQLLGKAHLVLFICDLSSGLDTEDESIFRMIEEKEKVVVFNKKDLLNGDKKIGIPVEWEKEKTIQISALTGEGVETVTTAISQKLSGLHQASEMLITNVRLKRHMKNAAEAIERAMFHYDGAYDFEIVSIEFKEALRQINSALGLEISDDILDVIFNQFCIGK